VKLTFLGTTGYINIKSRRHRWQTATLVSYRRTVVMLDCGSDWRSRVFDIAPTAIAITHAHADHMFGLKDGAPCPVWATETSWGIARGWRDVVEHRRDVREREPFSVGAMTLEAFACEHSVRAPAVGYRIEAGDVRIFYVPDLVRIVDAQTALRDLDMYVGDGAMISRSLIRRAADGTPVGHSSILRQVDWCAEYGVPRAVFTHCGTQIVRGDERTIGPRIHRYGAERGVATRIAHDGLEIVLV